MASTRSPAVLALVAALLFGAGVAVGLSWGGRGEGGVLPSGVDGSRGDGGGFDARSDEASGQGAGTEARTPTSTEVLTKGAPGGGSGEGAARGDGAAEPERGELPGDPDRDPVKPIDREGGLDGAVPGTGRTYTSVAGGPGGASGEAPPGRSTSFSPGAGRVDPPPVYELPETIRGRIFDASTGNPIPGAKVELGWQVPDGTFSSSIGVDVTEDGNFTFEARASLKSMAERFGLREASIRERYGSTDSFLAALDHELRGLADGYETFVVGDPGPEVNLALVAVPAENLPGTLRVDAHWPDGVRYGRRILVDGLGGDRGWFSQWALPEEDGTWILRGVSPGRWSFRIAGMGDSGSEVDVPAGGEARVTLRVPRKGVKEPDDAPTGTPREVEVSVAGRLYGPGSHVRAEVREGLFWRSEVAGSAAFFRALPAGKWTFVLETPGRPAERFEGEVPERVGRLFLVFPDSGKR